MVTHTGPGHVACMYLCKLCVACEYLHVELHVACVYLHVELHVACVYLHVELHVACVYLHVELHVACVYLHVQGSSHTGRQWLPATGTQLF